MAQSPQTPTLGAQRGWVHYKTPGERATPERQGLPWLELLKIFPQQSNLPWTNPQDARLIVSFYDSSPKKLGTLTGEQVVHNIEWRVYTEWCCNPERSMWRNSARYQGEGFYEWVREETHLAFERAGFKWDPRTRRFNFNGEFDATYQDTRERVLRAVVKRAVDFFKDCVDYRTVPDGNPENLRVSLERYLE